MRATVCLLLFPLVAGSVVAARCGEPAAGSAANEFEDRPQPLVEKQPRGEARQNRLEALSLFAAGRIQEQEEHLAEALRLYQRALRFDPDALPIVRQIIPLAFNLDRPNEAVRYALRAAEMDPSDPLLLRQLGLHLTEAGQFEQALKLYEQARARQEGNPKSAGYLLLTLEMGRLYFVTDKPRQAAEAFSLAMQAIVNPQDFGLNENQRKVFAGEEGRKNLELFAEAFLLAERPDDALAAYEQLQKLAPNKAQQAYHLARVQAAKKQPAEALAQLQVFFEQHQPTDDEGPYELLGDVLAQLGQQGSLIERLEKLAAEEPKNTAVRFALAEAALAAERWDQSEALYGELVKRAPTAEAYQGLVKVYRLTKRYTQLVKALGDAVAKSDGLDALGEQATLIARDAELMSHLVAAARAEYQADADRLDYGDRVALALLCLEAKQFDAAGEFFDLALKVKAEDAAELLLTWGMGLLVAEQYAEAAKIFKRGVDEHVLPAENPAFHYYLAGALEMAGRSDEALAVARAAALMRDATPRIHSRLAWVLYHAKRYDEAVKAYQDLIARFDSQYKSEETRVVLRDARLVLSNICVQQKNVPQAEEWLEQILDEYPENISALNDLGYLWAERGKNLERALGMIEQAVAGDPDNEAYRDSLGWALFQLGRYDRAVVELQKAAAADNPDGVILEHLGDAQRALGDQAAAQAAWQRALAAFERDGEAEKAAAIRAKLQSINAEASPAAPPENP